MLDWIKGHRRSAMVCGLTLLVPLLLYLSLLGKAWSARAEYKQDIDRLLPRIARMEGLKTYEGELTESAVNVRQTINSLVHPASTDRGEVSATLQRDVWQLMDDAGLEVTNSQVLPLREGEQFDYIGLKISVTGDVAALDEALSQLAEFTPIVIVEALDVWPNRQRSRDESKQELTASLKLVSLRAVI